jgi:type VI secretion system VasD/TssJ family lipoprotein
MQGVMKKGFWIICTVWVLLLSGCAIIEPILPLLSKIGLPSLPKHTLLAIFEVPKQLNQNEQGVTSPLIVYLLLLKKPESFQQAQFVSLYNDPAKVLGATLAKKKKFLILPGKKFIHIKMPLPKGVTAVGLLAVYSDIVKNNWRLIIPAPSTWGIVRAHVKFDSTGAHLVE